MKREYIFAAVALVFGVCGGFGLAQVTSSSDSNDSAEHSSEEESTHAHDHGMYEVSSEEAPSVQLIVEEDAKSGWNVHIMTENFTFAPEHVNGENVLGEGHAHLYVDGEKTRVYGNYFHYPETFDGTKTFRVTLNANDHSEYAVDGEVIEAAVNVTHDHDTMPHAHDDSAGDEDMHMHE